MIHNQAVVEKRQWSRNRLCTHIQEKNRRGLLLLADFPYLFVEDGFLRGVVLRVRCICAELLQSLPEITDSEREGKREQVS